MKYFKYLLGIIACLVIGFFLLGMIKPELSYECEIMVEKPIAECWAVSQDETKMADWLAGYQQIKPISGEPGKIGSIADVYFNNEGQEMIIRETITKIEPNESISMLFESDFMNMNYKFSMRSINGQTKIFSNTTAIGNGAISKSIMVLMGSFIKGQEELNLAMLKKTIESNSTIYSLKEN